MELNEMRMCPDKGPIFIATKRNLWDARDVISQPQALRPPITGFDTAREIILSDMVAEDDSHLFVAHIASLGIDFHSETQDVLKVWLDDEVNHFEGFKILNQSVFGLTDEEVEKAKDHQANFEPMAHLLEDEFSILLTAAYDEISTVKGIVWDLPLYRTFGPQFEQFAKHVSADEAWHYSKFLRLIRRYHADRVYDVIPTVRRIRETNVPDYQHTFILNPKVRRTEDQDDQVLDLEEQRIADSCAANVIKNLIR